VHSAAPVAAPRPCTLQPPCAGTRPRRSARLSRVLSERLGRASWFASFKNSRPRCRIHVHANDSRNPRSVSSIRLFSKYLTPVASTVADLSPMRRALLSPPLVRLRLSVAVQSFLTLRNASRSACAQRGGTARRRCSSWPHRMDLIADAHSSAKYLCQPTQASRACAARS
jgi:hypothetical protein